MPGRATSARALLERLARKRPGNLDGALRCDLERFLEACAHEETDNAVSPGGTPSRAVQDDDRFRLIFERAPLGMSLVDAAGRIIEVNQHLLDMLGLNREDYVGKPSLDFIHPDFLDDKKQNIARLMNGEITSYRLVEKRLHADGHEVWIRVTSTRIQDPVSGQLVRINMVEDIHEAKAAEDASIAARKQLEDVAGAIPGGVYEYCLLPDGSDHIDFANAGFSQIFEIPLSRILSEPTSVRNCILDEDREAFYTSVQESARTLQPWLQEFRIITPHGTRKWLGAEAVPQRRPDGCTCWHGLITDISGRKATEEELRKAKEQAEQATRAKSEFLTNISHEIRTPMNAVLGFSELLANELRDPIHRQYLQSIRSAGSTLLHLINDFLDLSRIEAGKITLHHEAISLPDLLDDIRRLFLIKTNEKGLEFWTHIDGRLPRYVLADETRLRQVLFNLVGNAVKFTRQGYVGIKIRRLKEYPDKGRVDLAIIVEDTGVGIQPEDQDRIFDSFEQQRGQSREFGGTGLGLAISQRIVKAMDGQITLDSEPERGSTFTVVLHNLAVDDQAETRSGTSVDILRQLRFKESQILVIDDNEASRTLIRGYLVDTGLEVREAANAEEAMRALKTRQPNLILLDFHLPSATGLDMSGDLHSRLTQDFPAIPIIALTANPDSRQHPLLQSLNVQGFLLKPLSRRELLSVLSNVLPEDLQEIVQARQEEDPELQPRRDWRQERRRSPEKPLPAPAREHIAHIVRHQLPEMTAAPDVDEVNKLALDLLTLANAHDLPVLRCFSEQLSDAIDAFDVTVMSRLISELPEFLSP